MIKGFIFQFVIFSKYYAVQIKNNYPLVNFSKIEFIKVRNATADLNDFTSLGLLKNK